MTESASTRREFVGNLAAAAGGSWLAAHCVEWRAIAAHAAAVSAQDPWEFFTPDEARDFDAISAQIVPTDETPGAREAHVVRFADRGLATAFRDLQPQFRNDLKLVADAVETQTSGNRSFAALSDTDQLALLTAFQRASPASFNRLRAMTMRGMFSHPVHGGNFNQVGWRLVGFEERHAWQPPFGYYDRV